MALLIFSKTSGYRHASLPASIEALSRLARAQGHEVEATEDAAWFTPGVLARFRAVVWLSTSGRVLSDVQRGAFERFVACGGAYVGIHSASATELDWPWYSALVGARFTGHPELQPARLRVEDRAHPATRHLGEDWLRSDEWYEFDRNPRPHARVLISVEEGSYSGGGRGDHPLAWCHEQAGGRAFYTALGHSERDYADAAFLQHLSGAISWALGAR